MNFVAEVKVWLKAGIADPEGLTINEAISQLGYQGVSGVSSGKVFRLEMVADSEEVAEERISELATTLLSNPVLEDYSASINEVS